MVWYGTLVSVTMVEKEEGEVEGEKREEEAMMVVTASQVVLLHLLRVVVGGRSLLLVYCDSFNIQGSCPIPVSSGTEGQTSKSQHGESGLSY